MSGLKKPNILFIFSDQQRADTIGFEVNGNKVTPNLDNLAESGVKFNMAFTPQPVCGPARACIQTGVYGTENGIFRNGLGLDAMPQNKENTIATWFRKAGYDVGYIGKWHLASNSGPADFDIGEQISFRGKPIPLERRGGYDQYWLAINALEHSSHGYNGMKDLSWNDAENPPGYMFDHDHNRVEFTGYRVDAQTDFILDYIEARDKDKPWFLFTSFIEPHHQNDHARYEGPEGSKEMFAIDKEQVPKDLWGADWLREGDWEENYPDYLGQCWSLDKNVQRMIEKLKEKGMFENTLIVYTSDHGSHFRTRLGEYKRNSCDGCLHVPMIVYGPGFEGGKEINELTSLLDLVPTILKTAGISVPEHTRGLPLQDIVTENKNSAEWRDFIFSQISESQVGRCIRTKKWKFSMKAPGLSGRGNSESKIYMEDFLFDLEEDPHELVNLVDHEQHIDVKEALKGKLITQMIEIGEAKPIIIPYMEIPKPPILSEKGIISVADGKLCLKLGAGEGAVMMEMDIPLTELFENILGKTVVFRKADIEIVGRMTESTDGIVIDNYKDDGSVALSEIMKDYIGENIFIGIFKPPKDRDYSDLSEAPEFFVFTF